MLHTRTQTKETIVRSSVSLLGSSIRRLCFGTSDTLPRAPHSLFTDHSFLTHALILVVFFCKILAGMPAKVLSNTPEGDAVGYLNKC